MPDAARTRGLQPPLSEVGVMVEFFQQFSSDHQFSFSEFSHSKNFATASERVAAVPLDTIRKFG